MKDLEVRMVKRARVAMLEILRSGRRMKQGELTKAVKENDPQLAASMCEDSLYGLVGLAVRIYESEFYRDPSDGAISLSLTKREEFRREKAVKAEEAKKAALIGTTAAGRIHDALEAAEA
jgi:hypothetical protein